MCIKYLVRTNFRVFQVIHDPSLNIISNIYMLFAGWEVRMVKTCDRGLENTARGENLREMPH